MQKILVTGGAGFVGSYVVRQLLEKGCEVVVFDAFKQYISPLDSNYQKYLRKRFEGIEELVTFVRGNTENKAEVRRAIMKYSPDVVVHLAALPIADLSNLHTEEALSSILHGTVNILEVIRDVNFVKRFVYISSSMVYGDFEYVPDEEHPKHPKEVYGGIKLSGEILTEVFGRRYGFEYVIIRPSAVYGPTDVNRRVSQIFVENALLGKELKLYNGGKTCLDFTYVEDTARGIVLAVFTKEARNQAFNITRGEGRELIEFAQIIKSIVPKVNIKIIKKQSDVFRPKRGAMDISKAKKILQYKPQVSLEEGIKKYLSFLMAD